MGDKKTKFKIGVAKIVSGGSSVGKAWNDHVAENGMTEGRRESAREKSGVHKLHKLGADAYVTYKRGDLPPRRL